jgi:hypothetical protein
MMRNLMTILATQKWPVLITHYKSIFLSSNIFPIRYVFMSNKNIWCINNWYLLVLLLFWKLVLKSWMLLLLLVVCSAKQKFHNEYFSVIGQVYITFNRKKCLQCQPLLLYKISRRNIYNTRLKKLDVYTFNHLYI